MIKKMIDILSEHAFFRGLSKADLDFISGCAKNAVLKENQLIANRGDPADKFYLIQEGKVAISLDIPGQKTFIFNTLESHDILGWNWLIPPYEWTFSAHAMQTTRAIEINGACLREKCEHDTRLGYELLKRLVSVLVSRVDAAHLHILDVYGDKTK
jgi:CRP/FNR family cyclic AMP-dependent transcriptional regulator